MNHQHDTHPAQQPTAADNRDRLIVTGNHNTDRAEHSRRVAQRSTNR